MVRCYDWTQLHAASSAPFRTSEATPSFESLLMQLNTEATRGCRSSICRRSSDIVGEACKATPVCHWKRRRDTHVCTSVGTNGPCTNILVYQIYPCIFWLSPALPSHCRSLATLNCKHDADSGRSLVPLRAVRVCVLVHLCVPVIKQAR